MCAIQRYCLAQNCLRMSRLLLGWCQRPHNGCIPLQVVAAMMVHGMMTSPGVADVCNTLNPVHRPDYIAMLLPEPKAAALDVYAKWRLGQPLTAVAFVNGVPIKVCASTEMYTAVPVGSSCGSFLHASTAVYTCFRWSGCQAPAAA